jgi:DNA ligase-1
MSLSNFAGLIDHLIYTPGRNAKLTLIGEYLDKSDDPDRGWAIAALAKELDMKKATPSVVRTVAETRVDRQLFRLSYDFVGDLAETTALIWPAVNDNLTDPSLNQIIETLSTTPKKDMPPVIEDYLDHLDTDSRYAFLKLITGGMRVGVSARLTKLALAKWSGVDDREIEEIWHALSPPYLELFDWLEGGDRPDIDETTVFRPMMLANPAETEEVYDLNTDDYMAEWKWDGIRVQLACHDDIRHLFSRTGDDISHTFPDVMGKMDYHGVLDGELLVRDPDTGVVAPFNNLQQRLNRKTVPKSLMEEHPAFIRAYDILFDGEDDLRDLPFIQRRQRLESWYEKHGNRFGGRLDLSPLIEFDHWEDLGDQRDKARGSREAEVEGVMLKRKDSVYQPGRPKGPWFKWKRAPLTIDAVLMYAQRGHGKRSSYYSDFTFGVYRDVPDGEEDDTHPTRTGGGEELVPIGKSYFGFTDDELAQLDKWVRNHTIDRFGPVRMVEPGLVLEIAFDSIHPSNRHKSGLAMRFPRVHRIRWDKPHLEAERLDQVKKLVVDAGLP